VHDYIFFNVFLYFVTLMNVNEFDDAFDNGESIIEQVAIHKLTRPALSQRRVNVDLPQWMIQSLD